MVCATFTSSTLVSLALFSPRAALNRAECLCALLLLCRCSKSFSFMLCGRDSGNKKEEKVEKNARFERERKKDKSSTNDDDDTARKEGRHHRSRSIERSIDNS